MGIIWTKLAFLKDRVGDTTVWNEGSGEPMEEHDTPDGRNWARVTGRSNILMTECNVRSMTYVSLVHCDAPPRRITE